MKIEYNFIGLRRNAKGDILLTVDFEREDGNHDSWMPKWQEIHDIVHAAVLTEMINKKGHWSAEMALFQVMGKFLKEVCDFVETLSED